MQVNSKSSLFSGFLALTVLGGCATVSSLSVRHETAARIAASAGMHERVVHAGIFNLTTWQRIEKSSAPVDLYIEGDGLAWLGKYTKSPNPTPPDPVALRLAAEDPAPNVIYMARPCQYTGWNESGPCLDIYWTSGVTAPEVIAAYNQALDGIRKDYNVTGFNLVGYSGGAAIAMLVAARRHDVLSIRTVVGNTDYAAFVAIHNVSPLKDSIDPTSVASEIAGIPQRHFIGGKDSVVPQDVFDGWKRASGTYFCMHETVVVGNSHEKGWARKWPSLLRIPVFCNSVP